MEIADCIKIIQGRLSKFNLQNAISKIIGYILLFYTPNDLALYASVPEDLFCSLTEKIMGRLSSLTKNKSVCHMPSSYPSTHRSLDTPLSGNDFPGNVGNKSDLAGLEEQTHSSNPIHVDHSSSYYNTDARLGRDFGSMGSLRSPSLELDCSSRQCYFPTQCYFFNRGSCDRGAQCRFFHGIVKDDDFSPESLDKLSVGIGGPSKGKNVIPDAISSLPPTHREKFTASQLFDYWKSIKLIDRTHGQHSMVPAEDAPRYAQCNKIFLSFPDDSTFTDDDVMNYFKRFGPVWDVKIPREVKRDFGFVSFYYPESVKSILEISSRAHYICGSRVLVKPYKWSQKTKIYDRNYSCCNSDIKSNSDINTVITMYENSRLTDKEPWAEQHALETERARIMEMQLNSKPTNPGHYSCIRIEDSENLEGTLNENLQPSQLLKEGLLSTTLN